jgi:hypothetical protein
MALHGSLYFLAPKSHHNSISLLLLLLLLLLLQLLMSLSPPEQLHTAQSKETNIPKTHQTHSMCAQQK